MNSMTSKLHSSLALWVSAPAPCVDVDVCLGPVSSPRCVVWSSMMDAGMAWRQLCDGNLDCSRQVKAAEVDLWEPRAWCPAGTQPERGDRVPGTGARRGGEHKKGQCPTGWWPLPPTSNPRSSFPQCEARETGGQCLQGHSTIRGLIIGVWGEAPPSTLPHTVEITLSSVLFCLLAYFFSVAQHGKRKMPIMSAQMRGFSINEHLCNQHPDKEIKHQPQGKSPLSLPSSHYLAPKVSTIFISNTRDWFYLLCT